MFDNILIKRNGTDEPTDQKYENQKRMRFNKICGKIHRQNRRIKEHENLHLVTTAVTTRTNTTIITNGKIKELTNENKENLIYANTNF